MARRAQENSVEFQDDAVIEDNSDEMVIDMMQTGETTGNVDSMLDKIADFYEDDAEVRAQAMAMILGVACLLLVGAYVLYIVVTFYGGRMAGVMSAGSE